MGVGGDEKGEAEDSGFETESRGKTVSRPRWGIQVEEHTSGREFLVPVLDMLKMSVGH